MHFSIISAVRWPLNALYHNYYVQWMWNVFSSLSWNSLITLFWSFLSSGSFLSFYQQSSQICYKTKSKPQHWIVVKFISNYSKTSNCLWMPCSEYEGVGFPNLDHHTMLSYCNTSNTHLYALYHSISFWPTYCNYRNRNVEQNTFHLNWYSRNKQDT